MASRKLTLVRVGQVAGQIDTHSFRPSAGQGGQHLRLGRRSAGPDHLAPLRVEHDRGRRAQNVEATYDVQVLLGIDLDVGDVGVCRGHVGEDPTGGAAGRAEGRRELQQGGPLPQGVGPRGVGQKAGLAGGLGWGVCVGGERLGAGEAAVGGGAVEAEGEGDRDGGDGDGRKSRRRL